MRRTILGTGQSPGRTPLGEGEPQTILPHAPLDYLTLAHPGKRDRPVGQKEMGVAA